MPESELASDPTTEEWRTLYERTLAFRDMAPWEWMADSDNFGVENPETGEIGYCSIMGAAGEHFALAVYRVTEGLHVLRGMQTRAPTDFVHPLDLLVTQKCLMPSLEDREMLTKRDREQIRTLGLKFRGRNAWPQFRSYEPGYEPWYLTGPEARFLTIALEQTLVRAPRLRDDPHLLPRPTFDGPVLVLVRGDDGTWRDSLRKPDPLPPKEAPAIALDDPRIESLHRLPQAVRGTLEVDKFTVPGPIMDEARPYFAQMLMIIKPDAGMLLAGEIAHPREALVKLQDVFTGVLTTIGGRPRQIKVRNPDVQAALEPLAERLNIRVRVSKTLPAIEEAQEGLLAFLTR
jgi:hypothetical protein